MPYVKSGQFNIYYEISHEGDGPTLVLVHGFGDQIGAVEWPDEQCQYFANQGFRIVKIDNRDAGLSHPIVNESDIEPYTHIDMADDVVAVIDHLDCGPVHLAGCSLGGYIVRWVAIRNPSKISSLTVVMSGSGSSPEQGGPLVTPEARTKLVEYTVVRGREEQISWNVGIWRDWLWGSMYQFPSDWVTRRVTHAVDRSYTPEGSLRTLKAFAITPPLFEEQSKILCPTLIMHGGEDLVFSKAHAEANLEKIPNSELWFDPKMGHIMHEEQWEEMAQKVKKLSLSI